MPEALLVFLKYPRAGAVKTRLAAALGAERAVELYRGWIGQVFAAIQPLRPRVRVLAYYDGADRSDFAPWLALADDWRAQPSGDLGERLRRGLAWALSIGPALAIGTDCLELDAALIRAAYAELSRVEVVLGPAMDGGYYLVGMRDDHRAIFEGVRWSCPETLADHLMRCRELGLTHALLPARQDIDTLADWEDYCRRQGRTVEWSTADRSTVDGSTVEGA